jgi:hypothetical protein
VIEFERRAAQVKALHAGYLVKELDGATLKGIFDLAFIDARVDDDGDCILQDDITLVASADPGKDAFKVYAFFPTPARGSRRSSSATGSTCTWWLCVRKFATRRIRMAVGR